MSKYFTVWIVSILTAIISCICLSQYITTFVQDLTSYHTVCHGIQTRIIWTADNVFALDHCKISDVSHHNQKQCNKYIRNSSELFVAGALFLFQVLVFFFGAPALFPA